MNIKTRNMMNRKKQYIRIAGLLLIILLSVGNLRPGQAQQMPELIERAHTAGIEQSQIESLVNRAEQRGINAEELTGMLIQAVAMAEQNLPYEMIFQKAFEGMAKGVPAQRMQPVLDEIVLNTGRAAEFVDVWVEKPAVAEMVSRSGGNMNRESFRNEMVKVSSNALSQSYDRDQLNEILNTIADDEAFERTNPSGILTAVNILSDLPGSSGERSSTAGVVLRALRAGFSASDLQKLPEAINMAQRRSQLPAAAVVEGVSQQLQGGVPAAQILQNLFNGNIGGGPPGNMPPGLGGNRPGNNSGMD